MKFGTRELIFIVLLVAMPLSSYYYIFAKWNVSIAQAQKEISNKQQILAQLKQATTSIPDLGKEITRLSKAIAMFEKRLPAQREEDVVLKEVSQLAAKHGLTAESVRTGKTVPTAHYSMRPMRMKIQGNFDGFYSFLIDLERLPRITRMPVMKLEKVTKKDADGQMKADIVLNIFFQSKQNSSKGDHANG